MLQKSNSLVSINSNKSMRGPMRTKTWCESDKGGEFETRMSILQAFDGRQHETQICHKAPALVSSKMQSTRNSQISCTDFFSSRVKNKLYRSNISQNHQTDSPKKSQVSLPFLNEKFKRNHPIYTSKAKDMQVPMLPTIDKIITACNSARYITLKLKHDIDAAAKTIQRDFHIISSLD